MRFSSPHGGLNLMGLVLGSPFSVFEGGRDTWDEAEPVEIKDGETEELIEEDAE